MSIRNIPNDHQYTVKLPYRDGGKYQVQPFGHPFFVIIEDDPRVPTVAAQVRPRTPYSILRNDTRLNAISGGCKRKTGIRTLINQVLAAVLFIQFKNITEH